LSPWQVEADLLADGRDLLEKLCGTRRYGHLFPGRSNPSLLLEAYQELTRQRCSRRRPFPGERGYRGRREGRLLATILKRMVRRDALARDRRLRWGLPLAQPMPMRTALPDIVLSALREVDPDVRDDIATLMHGKRGPGPLGMVDRSSREQARLDRGLSQLRTSLFNQAIAHPALIPGLHPQYIAFASSSQPRTRRHPIATLILLRLPLQFIAAMMVLFLATYGGAYTFLNNERLGNFLTSTVGTLLDGELAFESVEWQPDLILDLITGQPHTVHARGVRVYEGYKRDGRKRHNVTAQAEHLELDLVLHEIIPWNRMGFPTPEIPWILHFARIRNHGDMWINVREYQDDAGAWRLSLLQAFASANDAPAIPGYRRLGFLVEDANLPGLRLALDFHQRQGWGTKLDFDEFDLALSFTGSLPEDPPAERMPFRYLATAHGAHGFLELDGLARRPIVVRELSELAISGGMRGTPLGDTRIQGAADLGGSPSRFDGFLRDSFNPGVAVEFRVATRDAGPLAGDFLPAVKDGSRPLAISDGSSAAVRVEGPLGDPRLRFVAQGITLDLAEEPDWALDDVDLSVVLAKDPVPERWKNRYPNSYEPGAAPTSAAPERWMVYVETFRGTALDGAIRLHGGGSRDHIILGSTDSEPLMVAMNVDLEGINPEKLLPHHPQLGALLRGSAGGGVQVHALEFQLGGDEITSSEASEPKPSGVIMAELSLRRFRLTRDANDSLPRMIHADGDLQYHQDRGLDLRNLSLGTEGGEIRVSGGFDADFETLKPTAIAANVPDGPALLRQFNLDPYFSRAKFDMDLAGKLPVPGGKGDLSVLGAAGSGLALGNIKQASIDLRQGILRLRAKNAELLGGSGPLEVDLVLAERGKLLKDPKIRASLDLDHMDHRKIFGAPIDAEDARIRVFVDDGAGNPVALSKVQARGTATAAVLRISDVDYSNADAAFAITRDGLQLDRMTLNYSRKFSPQLAPQLRVPSGTLAASGTISFSSDPALDLIVDTAGLPISALTALLETHIDIQGKLTKGSRLAFRGTLRRPHVEGELRLAQLGAAGVPLGHGRLVFETRDYPDSTSPIGLRVAARREVHVRGDLKGPAADPAKNLGQLDWHVDATVAFPAMASDELAPDAIAHVRFDTLPLRTLLARPEAELWRDHVEGELRNLELKARYCPARGGALLEACARPPSARPATDPLSVELALEHFWFRPRHSLGSGPKGPSPIRTDDPCDSPAALCSSQPLEATLDRSQLQVLPWVLSSGGKKNVSLELGGNFDLSPSLSRPAHGPRKACVAGMPSPMAPMAGMTSAQIVGALDLRALEAILHPWNIQTPEGQVSVNLEIKGPGLNPDISGDIDLPPDSEPINLYLGNNKEESRPRAPGGSLRKRILVSLTQLGVHLQDGTVTAAGEVTVGKQPLNFGKIDNKPTFIQFGGACSGSYGLALQGEIDGELPQLMLPELFLTSRGAATMERLYVAGNLAAFSSDDSPYFEIFDGAMSFGRHSTELKTAFETFTIKGGRVEFHQCKTGLAVPCPDGSSAGIAIFLGEQRSAHALRRPRTALHVGVGDRGSASLWGYATVGPRLDSMRNTQVRAALSMVPFTMNDNSGHPELTAELSSSRISLNADGGTVRISGDVDVESSRWRRDAIQGLKVLSFADPNPPSSAPLPEALSNLELDLKLTTVNPFTIDNNVLKDFEARADLRIEGTVGAPDMTGSLDISRGTIDVDILGGSYDVEKGRVLLDRDLSRSQVALQALREEPVNIDGQLHALYLDLGGSLDAIEWRCTAVGDTSGVLGTASGCVDYLIFDAGNTATAESDLQQRGQGDLVGNRLLPVFGKLARLRFNDYLAQESPQLEQFMPEIVLRADQLGIVTDLSTRPEWLQWGWGGGSLGLSYLNGYPGSLIRDSRALQGEVHILEDTYLRFGYGTRSYTTRILILDPPTSADVKLGHHVTIPSVR